MSFGLTRATLVEVDDTGTQQLLRLKGMHGEEFTKVYRFQQHGFSSVPPVGSEGVLLRMGETERMLALGFEAKSIRPKGNNVGASVLYGDNGETVTLDGNKITIEAPNEVTVNVNGTMIKATAGRLDLGGEGGSPVMTLAGPSSKVFAVV